MKFVFKSAKNYVRDISIVIVGIVITFAGSELITKMVKKKEIRTVMELVKEEIEENTHALEFLVEKAKEDGLFLKYLIENEGKPVTELSWDTLVRHKDVIMNAYRMTLRNDAFELLKSFSLIPYIRNKELLIRINEAYDLMVFTQWQLENYTDYKSRVSLEVLESMSKEKLNEILREENVYPFYEVVLNDSRMWLFIKTRDNIGNRKSLYDALETLHEIMRIINKEYGLKEKEVKPL